MPDSKQILDLARRNNGVITTAMIVDSGLSRGSLKYLTDIGSLERVSRGVYTLPDAWEDEFINVQARYKRGIYSLDTVLFLCDLTDRTPIRFHMVFPYSYNLSNAKKEGILCSGSKEPFYSLGVTDLITPGKNIVKGYCAERTLCDVLKTRNHVDVQVVTDAYKRYVVKKDRNIPLLVEYARVLGVEKRVRAYLEVLL
jgi:predicted transcriptional regulator of viral defense system